MELLLNTKLELIDYETISILSEIEEAKHFLNSKFGSLMDFILENSESTDTIKKKMLKIQILNLVNSEEALIKLYEKYLEKGKKTSH